MFIRKVSGSGSPCWILPYKTMHRYVSKKSLDGRSLQIDFLQLESYVNSSTKEESK